MSASPIANDDTLTALNTGPIIIAILANDTDPDGDALNPDSITVTAGNAFGSLEIDYINGLLIYTPDAGFTGTEIFSYVMADMNGDPSNEATVTLTVVDVMPDPEPEPEEKDDLILISPDVNKTSKLTLRRNGDLLEVINERTGQVLLSHLLADINSLSLLTAEGARSALHLTIDFAFGGAFAMPAGLSVTGGDGRCEDALTLRGTGGEESLVIDGASLDFAGLRIEAAEFESLRAQMGAGDDHITLTGAISFGSVLIDDLAGDDQYTIATDDGGAAWSRWWFCKRPDLRIHDRGGNDAYHISATAGQYELKDNKGFNTVDFSDADGGVRFTAFDARYQSLGLGSLRLSTDMRISHVIGSAFDDVIVAGAGSSILDGGAGHDTLIALLGNHMLLGGEGNDKLLGGIGNDILIGGLGSDQLDGGLGDDVLIGGTTDFDHNLDALAATMAEWSSRRSFAARVNNLKNGTGSAIRFNAQFFLVAGQTVHDDGPNDKLNGGFGSDWAVISETKMTSIEKVG